MALQISLAVINPLWIAAWAVYFAILVFWVKDDRAPKSIVVLGAVLGTLSVISSYFVALLWAAPSIALMLHVIRQTFHGTSSSVVGAEEG